MGDPWAKLCAFVGFREVVVFLYVFDRRKVGKPVAKNRPGSSRVTPGKVQGQNKPPTGQWLDGRFKENTSPTVTEYTVCYRIYTYYRIYTEYTEYTEYQYTVCSRIYTYYRIYTEYTEYQEYGITEYAVQRTHSTENTHTHQNLTRPFPG